MVGHAGPVTADATWFRRPRDDDPGTGNAAYNAIDRHVVLGRADDVAAELDGTPWTYADLLAESAAFAGALRAFGVGRGDEVVVGRLPETHAVLVALAGARLGATCRYVDGVEPGVAGVSPKAAVAATRPAADTGGLPVVTVDTTGELPWEVVMRAGRTDPGACADVPGDGLVAVLGESVWTLADALGAVDGSSPPEGVRVVEVGGVPLWCWTSAAGRSLP